VVDVKQDGPLTYLDSSLSILYTSPIDTGCETVSSYIISFSLVGSGTWNNVTSSTPSATFTVPTALSQYDIQVYAVNSIGAGVFPSDTIRLISSALPNAIASISVTSYGYNYIALEWPAPSAPGYGTITYKLEVDEGFGSGFVTLIEQGGLTFTHSNIIFAHAYKYRVSASNVMGYGALSAEFTYRSRDVPSKPPNAPVNTVSTSSS
jgi:hypothetical protein